MEFVVAEVERSVDRLEGFEVNVHSSLLAVVGENGPAIEYEAIVGNTGVELEFLLSGRDGSQHGESVVLING